ncbi:MAG: Fur family transcriptional regulator [Candidatus Atabeyarchaeum deiterrae]
MNEYRESDLSIIEAFRKKGYRATPQRIAICRLALHTRQHPSAQTIYQEVKTLFPTVSLATVYKTLQTLSELGLIQELDFPQSRARFDSYMKPHINLVCTQCGSIKDLEDGTARELVDKVTSAAKFTTTGQRLDIYGICDSCRKKGRSIPVATALGE